MSKTITREIVRTKVKAVTVTVNEQGEPSTTPIPETIFAGTTTIEKAQKFLSKEFEVPVTVISLEEVSERYEMDLADFIAQARLVEQK